MIGTLFSLAASSLWNRKGACLLTLVAVALSVALFLGVEKARNGVRKGFSATISDTELIVGARSGQLNLLLYSVFRMGDATAEVSWDAYEWLSAREDVAWTVPLALGDSHQGYRVIGTTPEYFERYRYGDSRPLRLADGEVFGDLFDTVIGAEVARELGYEIGSPVILTHGLGRAGLQSHDNRPFRVSGILAPTGTPVDQSVHVSLQAITAIHVGWETGTRNPMADAIGEETIRGFDLTPRTVTAVLVGLKSKPTILRTKRAIDTYSGEPMMAIMPAVALSQLWNVTSLAERALIGVSLFVIAVGLVSILTSILTSLNARRREMSILRAIGARPGHIFFLLLLESALLGFLGAVLGVILIHLLLAIAGPVLASQYGVSMIGTGPGLLDLQTIAAVTGAAFLIGAVPAWLAFRRSLADGLSVKL